ncbi:MAG: adenylate/guanylate cyclase domain-containing protein, partial [Firmicutes bacterium]|nr:adenylate/guanylate cyclase domain-containing protein [Bacillota bacterium]
RGGANDGQIVVIGMDQAAIDLLGPMPWPRGYMAQAINYLNSDPANRPAVIGVDVLYTGHSTDPDAYAALAEACAEAGNVVMAAAATFGSDLVNTGSDFYMDERAVLAWDQPYDELLEAVEIGQINAMPDTDSIIRHALYSIDVPGIGEVQSFARVIYEKYCDALGLDINEEPETENGFFYLHYTAEPGSYYEDISFADLIEETVEPDYFADKIVLIGPYTMGMQDEYRTSINHAAPMYGIEIQANQIDAYRNADYPKEVSKLVQAIILFIISFAAAYVFIGASVKRGVLVWIIACVVWMAICFAASKAGIVMHVIRIPAALTILLAVCTGFNYVRAQREKRKVTSVFGRYVDPAIMNELLAEGGAAETLGGKNCNIAVLFVDIRGFTTMSESLPPATVVEIINKYLTLTTECIMRYHGTLDKFVGDCTMAFWNAPVEQEDPVYLACCAAMDMAEGAKPLAEELQQRFGRSVSFGVGVHYGPAVVGNIGAPKRMDFTAIGDTVNTASRLESNAPAGTIYISRIVADMLGDRATVTSLGSSIKLKGKAEGFEVLTLDSLKK